MFRSVVVAMVFYYVVTLPPRVLPLLATCASRRMRGCVPSVAQSALAASLRTSRFGLNEKLTAILAGIPGILIDGRNLAIV